jgi:glycerol kinase
VTRLYLAIDQGGHASRALVCDGDGVIVTQAVREITAKIASDRFEYDANALLRSVREVIGEALRLLGPRRDQVAAAGLATQRSNVVCWDRLTGAALSPIIGWQDRRAFRWLSRLRPFEGTARRITGLPLSAHYGANKLRWCLRNLPAVRAAHRDGQLAWGPMASYLAFHLLGGNSEAETGRNRPVVVDPVHAARTALWDLDAGVWSQSMLDLFGLPRDALPDVAPCRHAFGSLQCGDRTIPLTIMTGDQSAALYAHGRPRTDWLYLTAGTGAFVQRVTGPRRPRAAQLLDSIVFHDGRRPTFALEGTVNGAGSALDWLAARHRQPFKPDDVVQWLDTITDPPLFLNGVAGLGTPFLVADAPIRFIGHGDVPAQAVAVIESIVFLIQTNIERMVRGRPRVRGIHIGGGLGRFDGLCQRLADISGLAVHRCRTTETTARGLARLMAVEPGTRYTTARIAPREHDRFDPGHNVPLRRRYVRWKAEMKAALNRHAETG